MGKWKIKLMKEASACFAGFPAIPVFKDTGFTFVTLQKPVDIFLVREDYQ
jgi:hypothetical protein